MSEEELALSSTLSSFRPLLLLYSSTHAFSAFSAPLCPSTFGQPPRPSRARRACALSISRSGSMIACLF